MSWYKSAQQYTFIDPLHVREHSVDPFYIDKNNNYYYKCNICSKTLGVDEIYDWIVSPKKEQQFMVNLFDKNKFYKFLNDLELHINNIKKVMVDPNARHDREIERYLTGQLDSAQDVINNFKSSTNICYNIDHSGAEASSELKFICSQQTHIYISNLTIYDNFVNELLGHPERIDLISSSIGKSNRPIYTNISVPICTECANERFPKCISCEKPITQKHSSYDIVDYEGRQVCVNCVDDEIWSICSDCGKAFETNKGHLNQADGEYFCGPCYEQQRNAHIEYAPQIAEAAKKNPYPFKEWFPEGQNRLYIPFAPSQNKSTDDMELMGILEESGCPCNDTDYQEGYCWYNKKQKVKIGKFLDKIRFEQIKKLPSEFNNQDGKIIIEKIYQKRLNIFMTSRFRVLKKQSDLIVAISQDPMDIARMSSGRGWTSCMRLGTGGHYEDVFCEIAAGSLIAYLIRKDDLEIAEPLARIAIRRFVNPEGVSLALPEQSVYGNAPKDFYKTVKAWLENQQRSVPKGVYERKGGHYSDSFQETYEQAMKVMEGRFVTGSFCETCSRKKLITKKAKKQIGLNVKVVSYNNFGELSILINNRFYKYQGLPTSTEKLAKQIEFYSNKGYGKRLRDIITYLDKYRKVKEVKQAKVEGLNKKLFGELDNLKIYTVNGEYIRSKLLTDFIGGGNHLAYNIIPDNEIWLEEIFYSNDKKFFLIHELVERKLIIDGYKYEQAHDLANFIESICRKKDKNELV